MNDQLQNISTYESTLYSYKYLDSWIRQEYIGLEANGVQDSFMSRDNYGNNKREI